MARRNDIKVVAGIALVRIVVGYSLAHVAVLLMPLSLLHDSAFVGSSWTGPFNRWDAQLFTSIARFGYPTNQPAWTPFFPGYPLVLRIIHLLTLGKISYAFAGQLLSASCLVLNAIILYVLVEKLYGSRAGIFSSAFLVWFPTSFFFLASYPESLLITLFLVTLALVSRGNWIAASLVAGYATFTSLLGLGAVAAVAISLVVVRRDLVRGLVAGLIGSSGTIIYAAYLYFHFGNPLEFVSVQSSWRRTSNFPWYGIFRNFEAFGHMISYPVSTGNPSPANVYLVWILDDSIAPLYLIHHSLPGPIPAKAIQ